MQRALRRMAAGRLPGPGPLVGLSLRRALSTVPFAEPAMGDADAADGEREEIIAALRDPSPAVSSVYLYDQEGSRLFEEICKTPEYYITRTEDALLKAHVHDLISFADEPRLDTAACAPALAPTTIVECAAGNGEKVLPMVLASAARRATTYAPIDVSEAAIVANMARLQSLLGPGCPRPDPHPLVATNEEGLSDAARLPGRKSFLYLGSTLGNFAEPVDQLAMVGDHMAPGDRLLLGVDTPPAANSTAGLKTVDDVVAAYNDQAGITAAFTLNGLSHVNRLAGLDFDPRQFRHVAEWDWARKAIITHVEALRDDVVVTAESEGVGREEVLRLQRGDRILMEQSAKFSLGDVEALAAGAGLRLERYWMAPRNYFLVAELHLA